jgi:hypothetical protein
VSADINESPSCERSIELGREGGRKGERLSLREEEGIAEGEVCVYVFARARTRVRPRVRAESACASAAVNAGNSGPCQERQSPLVNH